MNVLTERWYAVVNDLIGGWCVMNRDYPPSQLNRDVDPDAREVGAFLGKDEARHVVALHNATLTDCLRCEGLGVVDDPSACGDEEHCAPMVPCSDCAGRGVLAVFGG